MEMILIDVNDIACTGCIGRIRKRMKKFTGVEQVAIIPGSGRMKISFNEKMTHPGEITRKIYKTAFRAFD